MEGLFGVMLFITEIKGIYSVHVSVLCLVSIAMLHRCHVNVVRF